jgi:hypothetical protein
MNHSSFTRLDWTYVQLEWLCMHNAYPPGLGYPFFHASWLGILSLGIFRAAIYTYQHHMSVQKNVDARHHSGDPRVRGSASPSFDNHKM